MRAVNAVRVAVAIGMATSVAGCVEPAYVQPGPVQLQPYPPPLTYRSDPDYRPPLAGPIPLQPPPLVQPLPPAAPAPTVTEEPLDNAGPIPVQDMPPPAPDTVAPTTDAAPAQTAPAPDVVRKVPTTGPGNNVPLEGFRPMKGQTRPAP